jgi:antitoxin (DNA-binding transcriptional repressor) of toxin-antitoxin stability system
MKVTATDLRKNLFHNLDLVIRGEPVMITYKGVQLRLVAEGGSKLARAVRRNALRVDPDSIVSSDADLMSTLNSKWAGEDNHL